ncbi:hypothetical protein LTS08_002879 [Lithohypha guttulata]|nr:hypothetical protein LTS08_002879 [Lithohypha guttulata]
MNAAALLTNQGWLGPGHSLDARLTDYGAPKYKQKGHRGLAYDPTSTQSTTTTTTNGNGLIKPLLVSQRHGSRYGIGKKAHEPQSGNEWWLKGLTSALANIGKSESERTASAATSGTGTPLSRGGGGGGNNGGLYGYFVAGQVMQGTLEKWNEQQEQEKHRAKKKRKSNVLEEEGEEDTTQQKDPLAVKPVKRLQTVKELETSLPYLAEREKGRARKHKKTPSTDIEQFTAMGQFFAIGVGQDLSKKNNNARVKHASVPSENVSESEDQKSKEQRRLRRKRRKEEEQERRDLRLARMVEEELAKLNSTSNSSENMSEVENGSGGERTRRKAERKTKKRKKRERDREGRKDEG